MSGKQVHHREDSNSCQLHSGFRCFPFPVADARKVVDQPAVPTSLVRPQIEPVSSCTLDGLSIGGSACESGRLGSGNDTFQSIS